MPGVIWQGSCLTLARTVRTEEKQRNQPKLKYINKLKYLLVVLIGIAGLGLQHAKADTQSYTLTVGNDPGLGAGPFGTVLVNRTNANTATITFTAAAGYLFVDGGAVAVNVNASSWT